MVCSSLLVRYGIVEMTIIIIFIKARQNFFFLTLVEQVWPATVQMAIVSTSDCITGNQPTNISNNHHTINTNNSCPDQQLPTSICLLEICPLAVAAGSCQHRLVRIITCCWSWGPRLCPAPWLDTVIKSCRQWPLASETWWTLGRAEWLPASGRRWPWSSPPHQKTWWPPWSESWIGIQTPPEHSKC